MTSIRNFALLGGTPAEILAEVNNDLSKRDIMDMFVTAWLGILNVKTGMLEAANAGHEFPIVSKNGKFELYQDIHGMVLGAIEGMEYTDYEIYLSKGDSIFLYTDGIAEANSSVDKLFGMDRIVDVLNKEPGASPEKMISNVSSAVDSFVESAEQFDDMTMICMTYKGTD
jgi:sigma-B regulation protein RsbU (phosphoserine phosphatase)